MIAEIFQHLLVEDDLFELILTTTENNLLVVGRPCIEHVAYHPTHYISDNSYIEGEVLP